jgi:type IV secretory pathway VirB2 component (pilin)
MTHCARNDRLTMLLHFSATPSAEVSGPFAAVSWVEQVLLGPLGTSLAVIAVAWFGLEMLTGKLSLRRGGLVVLGCFIFFGAPQLAQAVMQLARSSGTGSNPAALQQVAVPPSPSPRTPPPYDPYAGASVPNAQN